MSPNKNYIGAGLIAIAIVLFWALALPVYNRISDLDAAIRERGDLLQSRNTIMANIKNLNKEYQKRISEITKLSAVVPSKKSVAEILSAVDDVSAKNGIQLFSSAIIGQKASETDVNPYNLLSLEIGLVGSYPGLANFLRSFEKNLRLVDITSVEAAAGLGNTSVLNFIVKGNAYYLK
ncbi:MAG: type 4a pilus biogenesis protein PilO [Candidatus Yanofskybacteria bacterium]|nr:type 4a pilus biogenesis protein PilO [Candidatus Yanofskybacteria bacterium]